MSAAKGGMRPKAAMGKFCPIAQQNSENPHPKILPSAGNAGVCKVHQPLTVVNAQASDEPCPVFDCSAAGGCVINFAEALNKLRESKPVGWSDWWSLSPLASSLLTW